MQITITKQQAMPFIVQRQWRLMSRAGPRVIGMNAITPRLPHFEQVLAACRLGVGRDRQRSAPFTSCFAYWLKWVVVFASCCGFLATHPQENCVMQPSLRQDSFDLLAPCVGWLPRLLAVQAGGKEEKNLVRHENFGPKKLPGREPIYGKVKFFCPASYTLIDNKCVNTVTTPPVISCPYGAYRDALGNCVSVDSVKPERACPPGYESYDRGCVKRRIVEAFPKCPEGYQMLEEDRRQCKLMKTAHPNFFCMEGEMEDGQCVTSRIVEAKATCPNGFKDLKQGRCSRSINLAPIYSCAEGYSLSQDTTTGRHTCNRVIEVPRIPTCEPGFQLHQDVCVKTNYHRVVPMCKEGFTLQRESMECTKVAASNAMPYCKDGWSYDAEANKCFTTLIEDPLFACPGVDPLLSQLHPAGEYGRRDCVKVESHAPEFGCERGVLVGGTNSLTGQPKDLLGGANSFTGQPEALFGGANSFVEKLEVLSLPPEGDPFVAFNRSVPDRKLQRQPFSPVTVLKPMIVVDAQCMEQVVAPLQFKANCSSTSLGSSTNAQGAAVCLEVQSVLPDVSCGEEKSKSKLAKVRKLSEVSVDPPFSTAMDSASKEGSEEEKQNICSKIEVTDVIYLCPDGAEPTQGFTKCKEVRRFAPERVCPESYSFDSAMQLCVGKDMQPSMWSCPEGYNILGPPEKEGKPQRIKDVIPPTSHPILELPLSLKRGVKKFEAHLKKDEEKEFHTGLCERVEYATVQVVCPVGYRMEKEKKNRGKGCIAEKPVPATKLCDPGFFMGGGHCVKHVEIAPSLLMQEGDPIACTIREDGGISCGHSYEYPVALKDEKIGHGKVDTHRD